VQTLPGPIAFTALTMSAFLLDAGWTVLNQLCDSLISAPSGGRVRFTPLAPLIVMSFTDFPSATFVDFPNRIGVGAGALLRPSRPLFRL